MIEGIQKIYELDEGWHTSKPSDRLVKQICNIIDKVNLCFAIVAFSIIVLTDRFLFKKSVSQHTFEISNAVFTILSIVQIFYLFYIGIITSIKSNLVWKNRKIINS